MGLTRRAVCVWQFAELRSSNGLLERQVDVLKQAIRELEASAQRRATLGGMPTAESGDVSVNLQVVGRVRGACRDAGGV